MVGFRSNAGTGQEYCICLQGSRNNGTELRDECLNGEIFYSLKGAQMVIENWRVHYNTRRPHSALGYRPPAPLTIVPRLDEVQCMQYALSSPGTKYRSGQKGALLRFSAIGRMDPSTTLLSIPIATVIDEADRTRPSGQGVADRFGQLGLLTDERQRGA